MAEKFKVEITRSGWMYHWEAFVPPDFWTSYTGAAFTFRGARFAAKRAIRSQMVTVVDEFEVG